MTRAHGVVGSAGGLLPFAHAAWRYRDRAEFVRRAAEYIADGLENHQLVEYVGDDSIDVLREQLGTTPGAARIDVTRTAEHFVFERGNHVVHAARTVEKYVAATEAAIAKGYKGYRAVVDVAPVVRTASQRDAIAELEYLLDQKTAVLPLSLLCGYDASDAGAEELICLHPFVTKDAVMFRLYANPEAGVQFALAGEVDAASERLFSTTLHRIWPHGTDGTVRIDAAALEFIGHRQLVELDRLADISGRSVVLYTDQLIPSRLIDVLGLGNVRVEPALRDPDICQKPQGPLTQS